MGPLFGPNVEEEVIGIEKTAKFIADRKWFSRETRGSANQGWRNAGDTYRA